MRQATFDAVDPGTYVADLHIHSRYSRACSRDLDTHQLAWWARRKGITLLGTGDLTHPAWYEHLRETLRPAEPGLYRLRTDADADVLRTLPASAQGQLRFMLSSEISTIYKRGDRTRKVHHLVYLPDLAAAARFNTALGRIGNLGSDGRPILGLDSRDLLEITLEASPDAFLVPAHIWTPWFSALGSKSGFDAIADCYADLADHIFAVETGLSSDPGMNWRVSSLDAYRLVSNSDAHSAPALGREATVLGCDLDYYAVREALRTGDGLAGTIEFFPEEGKYHADGHRGCGVNWAPDRTRAAGGRCPECGRDLTVGVLSRVEDLADRPDGYRPPRAPDVTHLVPLAEIIGEIHGVGPRTKTVAGRMAPLVTALGPELSILRTVPIDRIARVGGEVLGEAITRLRRGAVTRTPGFDGEYGVIRLFAPGELSGGGRHQEETLFDVPAPRLSPESGPAMGAATRRKGRRAATVADGHRTAAGPRGADSPGTGPEGPDPASHGAATGSRGSGSPGSGSRGSGSRGAGSRSSRPRGIGPLGSVRGPGPDGSTADGPYGSGTAPAPPLAAIPSPHEPFEPMLAGMEEVGTGLLDRLDAMQRVAAAAPGGPLLIVAGPGTGKTRTLTHRIAYLCAELDVYPEDCLAITFTRRAAEELRTRLTALLGAVADDVTVGTFHSLGATILRENAESAGLADGWRIAEEADRLAALVEAGLSDERRARRLLGTPLVGWPDSGDGAVRDTPVGEVAPDGEPMPLGALATGYVRALRARNLVDLDDLIRLPVALLRNRKIADRYQARWPWIFVDEYQDVDADQYALLRLLCPPDGNLCAIGDPDQAIYSFRGADVEYFLRFARDFADARIVRLTRNYRSSAPILAAAVQAIAPSSLVRGRRLDPARLDPDAPLAALYQAASAADEADFVVRTIDELVGGVSHGSLDSGRVDARNAVTGTVAFSDIAVLYRTDAQAGPLIEAFGRAGIPVQKRSHDRLRDRPGVAALARELRYATGLGGAVGARLRLSATVLAGKLATPCLDEQPGGLTPTDVHTAVELLAPLAARCGDDLDRFFAELATGAEVDALDVRAQAVTLLTMHAAKGLEYPVVFLVGVEDGLLPHRMPGAPRARRHPDPLPTPGHAGVGGDSSAGSSGSDSSSSTGLPGGLPGPRPDLPHAVLAEERRLFFVGITRAQDRLFLSYARKRHRFGTEREMSPSPFLAAIDPGLLDQRGGDAVRRPRDRQLRLI